LRSSITARRHVRISRLAPTGEGISRGEHGVGFVAGALPGEEVEAEVGEVRRSFWRGRTIAVLAASRDRVLAPTDACPGCDWGHFDLGAARAAKRELFLETMQRIGKTPSEKFGELPIADSPPGYRVRNRFHLEGRGAELMLGQYAGRTHRVESVGACRALTPQTAALLPLVREALAETGAAPSELATIEDLAGERRLARATLGDTAKRHVRKEADAVARALAPFFAGVKVLDKDGRVVGEIGEPRLAIEVASRIFRVSVDTFFQGNRHLAARLFADVGEASGGPAGDALDAFGGVGFFAASLLEKGHSAVSVEGSPSAARDAGKTRLGWADADRWKIVPSSVAGFLSSSPRRFDLVVADPPRAGLVHIARPLGERARRRFVYVSCEPTTLARDLPELVAEGFEIADARLYDLFPLTHRVEAVVTLVRVARSRA
jgi:23S rRNA (uracil1939-C5)-methyltransferase